MRRLVLMLTLRILGFDGAGFDVFRRQELLGHLDKVLAGVGAERAVQLAPGVPQFPVHDL